MRFERRPNPFNGDVGPFADCILELRQNRPGWDPEVLLKRGPCPLEDGERFRVAAGEGKGTYPADPEVLAQRVLGDERRHGGEHDVDTVEANEQVDLSRPGLPSELGEAAGGGSDRVQVECVCERLALGVLERRCQSVQRDQRIGDCREPRSNERFEGFGLNEHGIGQPIGSPVPNDRLGPEGGPQPAHVDLNGLARRGRWVIRPEQVDEALARQRLPSMDHEQGQQRSLLAAPDREDGVAAQRLDPAEQSNAHARRGFDHRAS